MRAHEFIFETQQPQNAFRSQVKTWKDLEQALPRIQTAIDQFQKGNYIYRGIMRDNYPVLFKPQMPKGTRSSANTDNFYTLFIDNNVRWKNYPPRSASVIGSDNYIIAKNYGHPYVLLPEGDPTIGVTSDEDFWFSFKRMFELDKSFFSLDYLNGYIKDAMCQVLKKCDYNPSTWQEFKKDLETIDELNHYSFPNLPKKFILHSNSTSRRLLSFHPGTTMEEKLDYLLDPQANGIESIRLSSLSSKTHTRREIWLNAPCWLIYYDDLPFPLPNNFDLGKWIQQNAAEEH